MPGVAPAAGDQITRDKQIALATCNGLLSEARDELATMLSRGASTGLELEEVEDLAPLAQRVVDLRERRFRLVEELNAITAEWAA